ncbi:MAG: alcohol dehydrogenase catalytic domain-containing protein [Nanoarchaeota archaeon]
MYYLNSDVRVEEMPVPEIGDDDILLKIMASGICGSDLMEFHRKKKAPFVPGHEVAGVIDQVGKNVKDYKPGDRIFVTHHVPCDSCIECRRGQGIYCNEFQKVNNFTPGGFAPYVRVTGRSLKTGAIKLPDEMTYEQGSFIEPLGCVVEALKKLTGEAGFDGDSVLIEGAGVAGILNLQVARAYGAGRTIVTDINSYRLRIAKDLGADVIMDARELNPETLRQVNEGRLADKIIISTGAKSATEQAFRCYGPGSDIMFFATPPENQNVSSDWYGAWRGVSRIGLTYGATPKSNMTAFWLIKHGVVNVDRMITQKLPLEEIAQGFEIASEAKDCLKVLIMPNN